MKKQSLVRGTVVLAAAGIVAKFLGLFFRWPLIMLIGDEGVGYYQMSYPIYTFFIAIASGIPVAISKMVSERNAVGDFQGTIIILRKAIFLMICIGGMFTCFMGLFAKQIIHVLRWDAKSYYSLVGIALAPIFISIMSAFRGFFQGLQNMNPTAVSQVIEQIGRVIFGVGLAYILLDKGIQYSAGGAAFGAVAGGLLGGIYLIGKYLKIKREFPIYKFKGNKSVLMTLLRIAVPISIGATVGTVMSLIDSILVPQKLLQAGFTFKEATILYGQLTGKAYVLVNVPLTISMALCASLVPIIAENYVLKRRMEVIQKVDLAVKLSCVIAFPAFLGLCAMAQPVFSLIFPGHADGYQILQYLSISIPFIILAQISTAILQGTNNYVQPVIHLGIGCIVKILVTYTLVSIPSINVYGAIAGSIGGYVTAAVLNLRKLQKKLDISINFYEVMLKPIFAAFFMIIGVLFTYMYLYQHTLKNNISCLAAVIVGIVIYALLIVLFGIFKYSYIKERFLRK